MIIVRLFAAIIIFYFLFRVAKWLFLSSGKASEPLPNRQAPLKMEDLVEEEQVLEVLFFQKDQEIHHQ